MTNFEHIRNRLLIRAGLVEPPPAPLAHMSFDDIKAQECSDGFTDKMDNRIIMGFVRYGPMGAAKSPFHDLQKARQRLDLYEQTGNTEHLVDAANFCRCEAARSLHPNAHFHAQDRED